MKRAKKILKYVIEPKNDGFSFSWESFVSTNPSCIRIDGIDGLILSYRACGSNDRYFMYDRYVWGSSMGLAILDPRGEEVVCRFPLPIFKYNRDIALPQTKEEFDEYQKNYKDKTVIYHDFKLVTLDDMLYLYSHEGTLTYCYDIVYIISIDSFRKKVLESMNIINSNAVTEEKWADIWWKEGVFTPCGYNGTNKFWASTVNKTDIAVIKLDNGKIQLLHRPCPDDGVLETDGEVFSSATADGFTKYGVIENCVRPGFFDNSHIGNNGAPIRATIKGTPVYIDICHGVKNFSITDGIIDKGWDLMYVPFFRVKSALNGEVLYYSKEPVVEPDDIWKEYVEDGAWVSQLSHLRAVMFAGGQFAKDPSKITENDDFGFYTGVGDTAVARADFKISDLIDEDDMIAIGNYGKDLANRLTLNVAENAFDIGDKIKGWNYFVINKDGRVCLKRVKKGGICKGETAYRPVNTCAGYFDFGASLFDGQSVYDTEYGTIVVMKGINFRYEGEKVYSQVGYGLIILSKEHPEKILYHSEKSITPVEEFEGCVVGGEFRNFDVNSLLSSVDKKVLEEILIMYKKIDNGTTFASDHKKWLESRENI